MKSVELPIVRLRIPPEAECVPALAAASGHALLESIRERGVENPLRVWQEGDAYMVLSGRHRFQAATALGLRQVPCIVVPKPDDIRAAMIEEAVVCRDLPRAGRAILVLEMHPELMERDGAHHTETGMQNLKKPNVLPSVHSVNTRQHPIATLAQASERYGIHQAYFTAVLEARAACQSEREWAALRDALCTEPCGPARILSALRGIQSRGENCQTKVPGRAGADPSGIACRIAPSMETVFSRWLEVDEAARERFAAHFRAALPSLPDELVPVLGDACNEWSEARCLALARRLAERAGAKVTGARK